MSLARTLAAVCSLLMLVYCGVLFDAAAAEHSAPCSVSDCDSAGIAFAFAGLPMGVLGVACMIFAFFPRRGPRSRSVGELRCHKCDAGFRDFDEFRTHREQHWARLDAPA